MARSRSTQFRAVSCSVEHVRGLVGHFRVSPRNCPKAPEGVRKHPQLSCQGAPAHARVRSYSCLLYTSPSPRD
eukprot:621645-Alexandrium_andersonii.AAC.1